MTKVQFLLQLINESDMVLINVDHPDLFPALAQGNVELGKQRMKQLQDLLDNQDDKVELVKTEGERAYILLSPGLLLPIPRDVIVTDKVKTN